MLRDVLLAVQQGGHRLIEGGGERVRVLPVHKPQVVQLWLVSVQR